MALQAAGSSRRGKPRPRIILLLVVLAAFFTAFFTGKTFLLVLFPVAIVRFALFKVSDC